MSLDLPPLPQTPAVGSSTEAWNLYNAALQKVLADRQQIIVEAQLAASGRSLEASDAQSRAVAAQTVALGLAREQAASFGVEIAKANERQNAIEDKLDAINARLDGLPDAPPPAATTGITWDQHQAAIKDTIAAMIAMQREAESNKPAP